MRFSVASTLLALATVASAASSWTISDGTVKVSSKSGNDVVEKFSGVDRVQNTLTLGHQDKLKVTLTTKDGSTAKRPHQAFLVVKEASGLEAPFPLTVKDSGKGTVEISQKDLPVQLLLSQEPLEASLVLGSFGSSKGSVTPVFGFTVQLDPVVTAPSYEKPLRYGKLAEIHHIFRADPKNPPKIVSITFALAVLATVPALFIGWFALGGNFTHAQKALGNAPISHVVFFGSIVAMEGVFFLYYTQWNLFQTLPAIGVVGVAAFLSGTKALGEVQRRRLAGDRTFTAPSAEETFNHPAFSSVIWDLEPHRNDVLEVAKSRGGPVKIAWEIHGDGPIKIVLIMGLAGVKTSWQRQTKYFGHDHSSEYSVLILDNRGMGGSDRPLGRYTTSGMAADIVEVLDHVGWTAEREVHVVGLSLGGMIAQEVACAIPSRLRSLTLMSTTARFESAPAKTWSDAIWQRLALGFLLPKSEDQAIRETAQKLFTEEWLAAPDAAAALPSPKTTSRCGPAPGTPDGEYRVFDSNFQRFQAQELFKKHCADWYTKQGYLCQLVAAAGHWKSQGQLRTMADRLGRERIFILHGTGDHLIPVQNGERLIKYIEPGKGMIVDGMGHVPIMDKAAWVNGLLEERFAAWEKL
ncbi:Alpha/Beta hydrolase protein [Trichoderma chlorosporum]